MVFFILRCHHVIFRTIFGPFWVGKSKPPRLMQWAGQFFTYLFKPSPYIISQENMIYTTELPAIVLKPKISIWKLKFFYGFLLIIGGLVKHFLHITEKLKSLYIYSTGNIKQDKRKMLANFIKRN